MLIKKLSDYGLDVEYLTIFHLDGGEYIDKEDTSSSVFLLKNLTNNISQ